ncbi:MAG: HAMP domain-containing histidine kinase [Defluviimonas sp.]|uniref:sensor histidine kinase n=1 Tax=Albidovulum sp. TaxID=1872424 RepID=UPI002A2A3928|nr:HAMP domain-containing histidine kinase [Defluviimonas sp.]
MRQAVSWSMRFALALSAVFAIGTLSAGGLSYLFISRDMTERLTADVRSWAESLARIAATGDRADLRQQVLAQVRSSQDGASLFAFVDAGSGQTTGSLKLAAPFEGARRLLVGRDIPESDAIEADTGEAYLAYGIRTDIGWVLAARDEAWVAEIGEVLVQTTIYSLAIAALLSMTLAVFIARKNERRIDRMDQVLDDIGEGNLDRRIADGGNDDLAALAAHVDRMLDRLEAGVASIRQVSTDVAHDLRSPLARLRMRLEPQALSADLPAETRHEIGSALMDIDAIAATFDAILRLARLQSGTVERRNDPVDLGELAESVREILQTAAEASGHDLALARTPNSIRVQGDEDMLTQALTNLVANAVEHCPPPARILISVGMRGEQPFVMVSDDGPGIPETDRARVLERFVRLDASRSVPGTGLGLSLVSAIADLHRARLVLEDNAPGLRVSILFPAVEPAAATPAHN